MMVLDWARPDGGQSMRPVPRHREKLRHQGVRHGPLLEGPDVPRAQFRRELTYLFFVLLTTCIQHVDYRFAGEIH